VRLSSAQRRRLWGEFWSGNSDQIELAAGYKVSVPVALELEFEHNAVRLPEDSFTVDVYRINNLPYNIEWILFFSSSVQRYIFSATHVIRI